MIVRAIWRQNDDIATELYEDLYTQQPVHKDELTRVYETNAHYIIVDETNPCGGHLLYVEKDVPLLLAVAAAEKVIFDELVLNVEDEEEKEEKLDELAIPWKCAELIRNAKIVSEKTDYNEMVTEINVYFPTRLVERVLEVEKWRSQSWRKKEGFTR